MIINAINAMSRWRRRAKLLQVAGAIPPGRLRAQAFRHAVYHGERDQKFLRCLVDLALEDGANADDVALQKYANALHAGRRVGVLTSKVIGLSTDPHLRDHRDGD